MRVVVTGMGMIASIGNNVEQAQHSLTSGQTGIRPIKHLSTVHQQEFLAGEVELSDDALRETLGVHSIKYNRTALLGMIAAREAVTQAGYDGGLPPRTGLISSTSVGGMVRTELHYKEMFTDPGLVYCLDTHDCGDSTERIADYLGVKDYVTTISTACSSSANALMLGARMIKAGKLDVVIAGGTDALSRFTLNGFNSLLILDHHWCKPFDDQRAGLNLGEGAAYLVLESEEYASRRNHKPLAELRGYGNANDAYHQTASSPEGLGATLAMKKAFSVAGFNIQDIDYVNAHGTGTGNNDLSELTALTTIFGSALPPFSSTKAYTGHTLAAAGAIEAVISVLSMQQGTIFPNLNFATRMKEFNASPVTELKKANIRNVLSNSFGFGGNCSALILSRN